MNLYTPMYLMYISALVHYPLPRTPTFLHLIVLEMSEIKFVQYSIVIFCNNMLNHFNPIIVEIQSMLKHTHKNYIFLLN